TYWCGCRKRERENEPLGLSQGRHNDLPFSGDIIVSDNEPRLNVPCAPSSAPPSSRDYLVSSGRRTPFHLAALPSTPAENASQPKPRQAPAGPKVGWKTEPNVDESKKEASIGSAGPAALAGVTFIYSTSLRKNRPKQKGFCVLVHIGTTANQ